MHNFKPKVLMFGWEFPPYNSGGLGVACYGLTKSLVDLGADITFVLPKNIGINSDFMEMKFADTTAYNLKKEIVFKELSVFLYPYLTETAYHEGKALLKYVKNPEAARYAGSLYDEVQRYAALSWDIARFEKYDLIHAHDWLSFPAGIKAKKISGKRLITHVHSTEFDRTGRQGLNERVYEIEKEGFHNSDKVVAVSKLVKDTVTEKYEVDPDKVEVIHNGIDEDYFKHSNLEESRLNILKNKGYKMVLFLGRITIQKGPDYFIRIAKRVLEYQPKTFFLVVGAGDMEKTVMHLAADLGISDKIIFCGWLRGKDLEHVYKASDLYIMPSVSEPFGLTTLESMINGTPVIVSRQSGVSEVANDVLKADFWDIDEMANKIISVLSHDSLHRCLRENARNEVKKINWKVSAQKCLNLYNQLLFNPI
jgi:glycogen synthase